MEPSFIQLLKDAVTSEAALKIAYEAVSNTKPLWSMKKKLSFGIERKKCYPNPWEWNERDD